MSKIKIRNEEDGSVLEISSLKGKDYVLTEEDKLNLVNQTLALINESECIPLENASKKFQQILDRTITEITAEDLAGITEIGNTAFASCEQLKRVTIPKNIKKIGNGSFSGSGVEEIIIDNGITTIEKNAFSDSRTSKHRDLYIKDLAYWCNKITFANNASVPFVYGGNLYVNNELVTKFVSPLSITGIAEYAFNGCTSITEIEITDNVSKINMFAFQSCKNLTSVIIGNGCRSIVNYAFSCPNLKTVRIGNGIKQLHIPFGSSITDIYIDVPENSISGAPWGATNATVHWNTPLPNKM